MLSSVARLMCVGHRRRPGRTEGRLADRRLGFAGSGCWRCAPNCAPPAHTALSRRAGLQANSFGPPRPGRPALLSEVAPARTPRDRTAIAMRLPSRRSVAVDRWRFSAAPQRVSAIVESPWSAVRAAALPDANEICVLARSAHSDALASGAAVITAGTTPFLWMPPARSCKGEGSGISSVGPSAVRAYETRAMRIYIRLPDGTVGNMRPSATPCLAAACRPSQDFGDERHYFVACP